MIVKNIIKNTAQILKLNDVYDYINDKIEDIDNHVLEDVEMLILAVNMVSNSIASNYIELIGKTVVENTGEILPFYNISNKSLIEIKKVFVNNKSVDFKVLPEGVKMPIGRAEILFSYFPDDVGIDDEINCFTKVNELIFAQGVAGEYLFLKGAIEDAYMWDKKFKQSLINLLRPKKNFSLRARRWC